MNGNIETQPGPKTTAQWLKVTVYVKTIKAVHAGITLILFGDSSLSNVAIITLLHIVQMLHMQQATLQLSCFILISFHLKRMPPSQLFISV